MFHDLDAKNAASTFLWLKQNYHLIGLQEYLDAVQNGISLPKKSLILTFDDGHAGNYQLLPFIKQYQIPVTIFLCSDIVGTHRHFWFKHSKELKSNHQHLKKIPNAERLEALKVFGYEQTQEYEDRQALTNDEIEEMKSWVDFQSHTCFHPCLPQCDEATAREEIAVSKQHLERDYGLRINTISYPNGDYTDRDICLAKEAGYICGITVDYGFNDLHTDLFQLKRISVNDARSMDELIVKASGCYAFMKQLLKRKHQPIVKQK
ncbi:MAG: polysaccharide deacetylase family protein [Bacteroidaceae bacterium]|nr:polysaccharide deacetylase family protein [Bacteroidaceae bacterium]